MAQTTDYHTLISNVQDQEAHVQQLERENDLLRHQLQEQEALATKRFLRVKALYGLSLGILKDLQPEDLYRITTQTVTNELGWDSALVVAVKGSSVQVLGSSGTTEKQLNHLHDFSGKNVVLADLAAEKRSFSTIGSSDKVSFALRVLFQAEEVIAVPVAHTTDFYGYLVGCLHNQRHVLPSYEDGEFLAVLASHIGQAIYNTTTFTNLKQQNLRLKELDELKDSFISITSHQLRTPLSIIKWILSILQADAEIGKFTEQHRLIEQAYVSNERLIHVVNDLLNASRIHEGRLPLTPQQTDLKEMVRDVSETAQKIAEGRKITITYEVPENLPVLYFDPIIFKSALQNLIDNAIDYNIDGGWVKIVVATDETNITVAISNSGEGIPVSEQEKIFAQFYRSPEAVVMHPNGNGLGLYITQAIVHQHGGEIAVQSENEVTTFTITIPLSKLLKS